MSILNLAWQSQPLLVDLLVASSTFSPGRQPLLVELLVASSDLLPGTSVVNLAWQSQPLLVELLVASNDILLGTPSLNLACQLPLQLTYYSLSAQCCFCKFLLYNFVNV